MAEHRAEIQFYRAADGYRCAARVWRMPSPIGRIVFLHGIISHGGWYSLSCQALAAAGFEVHFFDRRGSGLNAEGRGDVVDCQTWIDDVSGYISSLPGDVPKLLMGISWGGKLAVAAIKRQPELVAGLALICPGLYAQYGTNWFQRRALAIAASLGLEKRKAPIPLRNPALFTDAPAWQRFIGEDPLTLRTVTIRAALADLELTKEARRNPELVRTPTLLMLSSRDRIIDNARVRDLFSRFSSSDKRLLEYPAAHTLEFEDEPGQYLQDLCGWARHVVTA
jgi:alpha-beta hydrolase superfamily lysophospholipase